MTTQELMMSDYLEMPWSIKETIENFKDLKEELQHWLKALNNDGRGAHDAEEVAFDFNRAIEALEKQDAKKPKLYKDSDTGILSCPKCEIDLWDIKEYGFDYCPYCGQLLNWNNEVQNETD